MPQQIQITPEQIPAFIEQNKQQLAAVEEILDIKNDMVAKLDEITVHIANGNFSEAAILFIKTQKTEYITVIRDLEEKRNQVKDILKQLEASVILASHMPAPPPNRGGFKVPRA